MLEDKQESFIQNKISIQSHISTCLTKIKIFLFFLGLINNTPLVLVHGISKTLSIELKKEDYMPVFSGAMISLTFFASLVYARTLIKIKHMIRIIITIIISIFGGSLIILSLIFENILLCLFGASLIGIGQLFGILTIMGFVKSFDSSAIGGMSAGTGGAGLFGSLYLILMKYLQQSSSITIIIVFLAYIPYFIFFFLLVKQLQYYKSLQKIKQDKILQEEMEEQLNTLKNQEQQRKSSYFDENESQLQEKEAQMNVRISINSIKDVGYKVSYYLLNLFLMYWFEYSIFGFLAKSATGKKNQEEGFFNKNSFEIIFLLLQIGVFLGRGSLDIVKIPYLYTMNIILFLLYVIWIGFALFKTISTFILIPCMFIVGLLSGLQYVNNLFLIYKDKNVEKNEIELIATLTMIMSNAGVIVNSITGYIFLSFFDK